MLTFESIFSNFIMRDSSAVRGPQVAAKTLVFFLHYARPARNHTRPPISAHDSTSGNTQKFIYPLLLACRALVQNSIYPCALRHVDASLGWEGLEIKEGRGAWDCGMEKGDERA